MRTLLLSAQERNQRVVKITEKHSAFKQENTILCLLKVILRAIYEDKTKISHLLGYTSHNYH